MARFVSVTIPPGNEHAYVNLDRVEEMRPSSIDGCQLIFRASRPEVSLFVAESCEHLLGQNPTEKEAAP